MAEVSKNASDISHFPPICVLNIEGKIFFNIVTQRLSTPGRKQVCWYIYTQSRNSRVLWLLGAYKPYLAPDPSSQEGQKRPLCDLPWPGQIIWLSSPSTPLGILQRFLRTKAHHYAGKDLLLCFITADFTTTGQCLEVGITEGCTLSPLAFTMVIEVIRVSRCALGGEQTKAGLCLLQHAASGYLESCRKTSNGPGWKSSQHCPINWAEMDTPDAVQQATSALRDRYIVGHIQQGRGGFGMVVSKPT